ncbi:MAG: hypothetical protein ABEJ55_06185 [Halanaeroarchaeum sp.]
MGRFDAASPAERRALIADAIDAHRSRGSRYCTLTAGSRPEESVPAWVQYRAVDSLCNVDVEEGELDRLVTLLDDVGGATIDEQRSPEDLEGINVRIRIHGDDERVAQFVDRVFRRVYDRPADYRLWATEI